jgi:hypothetical protein
VKFWLRVRPRVVACNNNNKTKILLNSIDEAYVINLGVLK